MSEINLYSKEQVDKTVKVENSLPTAKADSPNIAIVDGEVYVKVVESSTAEKIFGVTGL